MTLLIVSRECSYKTFVFLHSEDLKTEKAVCAVLLKQFLKLSQSCGRYNLGFMTLNCGQWWVAVALLKSELSERRLPEMSVLLKS